MNRYMYVTYISLKNWWERTYARFHTFDSNNKLHNVCNMWHTAWKWVVCAQLEQMRIYFVITFPPTNTPPPPFILFYFLLESKFPSKLFYTFLEDKNYFNLNSQLLNPLHILPKFWKKCVGIYICNIHVNNIENEELVQGLELAASMAHIWFT